MSPALLTSEHEQLSVDGKQLGDGVLEAAAGIDLRANSVDPLRRNGLDMLVAGHHKSEGIERMAGALGAMAAWFAATPMGERQAARERIGGNAEAHQQPAFASFQGCGLRPYGRIGSRHLIVIIQSACH